MAIILLLKCISVTDSGYDDTTLSGSHCQTALYHCLNITQKRNPKVYLNLAWSYLQT